MEACKEREQQKLQHENEAWKEEERFERKPWRAINHLHSQSKNKKRFRF